jgi:hypothetical protein
MFLDSATQSSGQIPPLNSIAAWVWPIVTTILSVLASLVLVGRNAASAADLERLRAAGAEDLEKLKNRLQEEINDRKARQVMYEKNWDLARTRMVELNDARSDALRVFQRLARESHMNSDIAVLVLLAEALRAHQQFERALIAAEKIDDRNSKESSLLLAHLLEMLLDVERHQDARAAKEQTMSRHLEVLEDQDRTLRAYLEPFIGLGTSAVTSATAPR